MKKLTLAEILNYLSMEEIEDVVTKELVHTSTEDFWRISMKRSAGYAIRRYTYQISMLTFQKGTGFFIENNSKNLHQKNLLLKVLPFLVFLVSKPLHHLNRLSSVTAIN